MLAKLNPQELVCQMFINTFGIQEPCKEIEKFLVFCNGRVAGYP